MHQIFHNGVKTNTVYIQSKSKSNQRFEKNPDIVPLQTAFMSVHRI